MESLGLSELCSFQRAQLVVTQTFGEVKRCQESRFCHSTRYEPMGLKMLLGTEELHYTRNTCNKNFTQGPKLFLSKALLTYWYARFELSQLKLWVLLLLLDDCGTLELWLSHSLGKANQEHNCNNNACYTDLSGLLWGSEGIMHVKVLCKHWSVQSSLSVLAKCPFLHSLPRMERLSLACY